jgi:Polyketide cyclase / dehydrase and lipid transport
MATAYASCLIEAPVEAVWDVVRDFNALPSWNRAVSRSTIEDGLASDVVGCVRSFYIGDQNVRERLLSLDDSRYRFAYNFETPAFPVSNYQAVFELIPVTDGDRTFANWSATFDEAASDTGKYVRIVSNDVFVPGLKALSAHASGHAAPPEAVRWQGFRPAKVFCSSVINGPVAAVWQRMRDFAGMDEWHPDITNMRMVDGARPGTVSGVRDFRFGDGSLQEQLTLLCELTHAFRYKINRSDMPWLNYHAGARLYPISDTNTTFAVWTADWVAAPNDDVRLIPMVHQDVFQKAFDTINARFFGGNSSIISTK